MKHTWSGRDEKSMMKLVVAHESDRVLGCHMPVTSSSSQSAESECPLMAMSGRFKSR